MAAGFVSALWPFRLVAGAGGAGDYSDRNARKRADVRRKAWEENQRLLAEERAARLEAEAAELRAMADRAKGKQKRALETQVAAKLSAAIRARQEAERRRTAVQAGIDAALQRRREDDDRIRLLLLAI